MTTETNLIAQVWPGWQADELIGRGAFGSVYRASRTVAGLTMQAAVKIIDIPSDASEVDELQSMGMDGQSIRSYFEETARSIVSEIAVMNRLKGSPHIVHVEDFQLKEHADGVGWSVLIRMELLEALTTHQRKSGMPDQHEVARMGSQLCDALTSCHAEGIIHRDVKPANVFITKYGDYKLGDFGIAKQLADTTRSTMSHAGTSAFMAPEVESGRYDESVDTYSLGIMLYRWLNGGRPPFVPAAGDVGQSDLQVAQVRRLAGERPPLPAGPGVDPGLASIVTKACEPDPANRWRSAEDLGRALEEWLEEHPAPADSAIPRLVVEDAATEPGVSPDAPFQDPAEGTVNIGAWVDGGRRPENKPIVKPETHVGPSPSASAPDGTVDTSTSNVRDAKPGNPVGSTKQSEGEGAHTTNEPATKKSVGDNTSSDNYDAMEIAATLIAVACALLLAYEEYRTGSGLIQTILVPLFSGGLIFGAMSIALPTLLEPGSTAVKLIAIAGGCALTAACVPGDYAKVVNGTVDWGYLTIGAEVVATFFGGVCLAALAAAFVTGSFKKD